MAYPNHIVEMIAKVAHGANAALQAHLGDFTPVAWEETDQKFKDAIYNGVWFHLNNPDATPRESHENWCKAKNKQGWEYGEVRNDDLKRHPNLVPYEHLPEAQRAKDLLFKNIVRAFASSISDCDAYLPKAGGGVRDIIPPKDYVRPAPTDSGRTPYQDYIDPNKERDFDTSPLTDDERADQERWNAEQENNKQLTLDLDNLGGEEETDSSASESDTQDSDGAESPEEQEFDTDSGESDDAAASSDEGETD